MASWDSILGYEDAGESEERKCSCGHTARWHGDHGNGVCEHNGECRCRFFHWQMESQS